MSAKGSPIKATPFFDDQGKRYLKIEPLWARSGMKARFTFIPEKDLWMYSEGHNPAFKSCIATLTMQMNRLYDFGLDEKRLFAKIATEIEFGIQDTIHAKPPAPKPRVQIGEIDIVAAPRNAPGESETIMKDVPLYDDQLPASASSEEVVTEIVHAHDDDPRGRDI